MIESAADEPVPLGGDALIMDFGIARSVEGGATQTAAGSVIGTLEYMAPEQAQGKKVDQRADQYAFGLIVYDMLVGRQRLASRGEGPMAELLQRISAAPPAPRTIKPEIPEAVNDIVMRCLQPKPDDRYPTTLDLVQRARSPDARRPRQVGCARGDRHQASSAVASGGGGAADCRAGRLRGLVRVESHQQQRHADALGAGARSDLGADRRLRQQDRRSRVRRRGRAGTELGIEGASFVSAFPRRDALRAAAAIKAGAKLDEPTARLVALRENLGLVLIGAIEPKGSGYHITVKGVGPGNDAAVKFTLEDDAASKAGSAGHRRRAGGPGPQGAGRYRGAGAHRHLHGGQPRGRARVRARPGAACGRQGRCGDSRVPGSREARSGFRPRVVRRGDRRAQYESPRRGEEVLRRSPRQDRPHDRSREAADARSVLPVHGQLGEGDRRERGADQALSI